MRMPALFKVPLRDAAVRTDIAAWERLRYLSVAGARGQPLTPAQWVVALIHQGEVALPLVRWDAQHHPEDWVAQPLATRQHDPVSALVEQHYRPHWATYEATTQTVLDCLDHLPALGPRWSTRPAPPEMEATTLWEELQGHLTTVEAVHAWLDRGLQQPKGATTMTRWVVEYVQHHGTVAGRAALDDPATAWAQLNQYGHLMQRVLRAHGPEGWSASQIVKSLGIALVRGLGHGRHPFHAEGVGVEAYAQWWAELFDAGLTPQAPSPTETCPWLHANLYLPSESPMRLGFFQAPAWRVARDVAQTLEDVASVTRDSHPRRRL